MLAAHDLSSEKELLDLVFSESGVVGGTGNARANEASHCSENEPPPIEIMRVHRSTLPDGAHKSTPKPVDRQPKMFGTQHQSWNFKIELYSCPILGLCSGCSKNSLRRSHPDDKGVLHATRVDLRLPR